MNRDQPQHDERFTLANEAPRPQPQRFENQNGRQTVLLAGLDCLPGQRNLFQTDGEEEAVRNA